MTSLFSGVVVPIPPISISPWPAPSRPQNSLLAFTLAGPGSRKPALQVVAVGINEYGPPGWRLDYSRNDAQTIAQTLSRRAGRVFGEVSAFTLLEASASLDAIEEHVLRAPASSEDVLVVYLAGHGYALPEGEGWEWYFLPFPDAWSDPGLEVEERVRRHGLSSRRLMRFLVETQPRRVFLILDSCRSGTVIEAISGSGETAFTDAVGRKALRRMARVGGIHVLAAARANEDAWELVSQPHGALTYLVLEAVRGAADTNLDQAISVREICWVCDSGDASALEAPAARGHHPAAGGLFARRGLHRRGALSIGPRPDTSRVGRGRRGSGQFDVVRDCPGLHRKRAMIP